ncbi:MAG: terpene cyclase/mutase family protein [Pirellulales bacterium]|nr:terpene cyclase/mutase family protein [Pirellulales bacterium]
MRSGRADAARDANSAASDARKETDADNAKTAATQSAQETEGKRQGPSRWVRWMRSALQESPSWLVSMVFHMLLIICLALWTFSVEQPAAATKFVITRDVAENLEEVAPDLEKPPPELNLDLATDVVKADVSVAADQVTLDSVKDLDAAAVSVELSDFGLAHAPKSELLNKIGTLSGKGFSGRRSGARGTLVRQGGGTPGSERAVALALQWFARHQMPDGGWCFNHDAAPQCQGQCRNPGSLAKARIAATSLALLPFLGAGQTHKEGKYKPLVKNGLYFLINQIRIGPEGARLDEPETGFMYSHGLASIVLCEAYALTHDKGLQTPAQGAINFICYAQDPVGGGWRYMPRQKGDTSVVGWQIMALKSAHMAYLNVPPETVKKAYEFLDSVQTDSGANYGYTDPGKGPGTTAIGLLCRMYLGWKKDNPALQRGVEWLCRLGPSEGNMYYNYYATQVLHHWEGPEWKKWNEEMREFLILNQAKLGHEEGSWFFSGSDAGASKGGRLYFTALAAMTLEVYYRYLPLYRSKSTEDEFPM